MSEVQFWVKNPNDQFKDFNTRLDPNGLSFYSSDSYKSHVVGVFNGKTSMYDKKYRHGDVNNVKYIHANSGQVDEFYSTESPAPKASVTQQSAKSPYSISQDLLLTNIPNHASTMNIRFVSDSSAQVQNATVKVASISNTSSTPSNVNFKVAQIMHPEMSAIGALGSGDSSWTDVPAGSSASAKSLNDNPGISGIGTGVSSIRHDWYLAVSGKSTDIGGEGFQMIFSLEYI
jgi:hypothetical protein